MSDQQPKTVDIDNKIEDDSEHQWAQNGSDFQLVGKTIPKLEPGYYAISEDMSGRVHFTHQAIETKGLMQLDEGNTDEIIKDIEKFWEMEEIYARYKISFKRGIMMSGPPGTGKTCIIKLLLADMISRGGICIDMHPKQTRTFTKAVNDIRSVQPNAPVLAVIEDFQSWMVNSSFLNMMDGLVPLHKVVVIATTNYEKDLPDTIINRPGRFDSHFRIPMPGPVAREALLRTMIPKEDIGKVIMKDWVRDSKGFSMGHLKEFVTSVLLFQKGYKETVKRLKSLREGSTDNDEDEGDLQTTKITLPEGTQLVCDECGETSVSLTGEDGSVRSNGIVVEIVDKDIEVEAAEKKIEIEGKCLEDECEDQDCEECSLNQ